MKNRKTLMPLNFFQNPLMMESERCEAMLAMLNQKASLLEVFSGDARGINVVNGIAVIQIGDVLTYKSEDLFSFVFGGTSYMDIKAMFNNALNDSAINGILFDINSAGGEVAGLFDLVDEIYNARGQKPIIAIANEMAYSAAYAIASAADKVYLTRTAGIGSIGVLAVHIDRSKQEEDEGLKYNLIYAGENKIERTSHKPLSEKGFKSIQKEVDELYELFADTVARNRNMTSQQVKDTKADIFRGKEAVNKGLADAVMSFNQTIAKFNNIQNKRGGFKMQSTAEKIKAMLTESRETDIAAVFGELGYMPRIPDNHVVLSNDELSAWTNAVYEQAKTEGKQEIEKEKARIEEVVELCSFAGKLDILPALIKGNCSIEEAKKAIIEAKAADERVIRSSVRPTTSGFSNPLIEDAKTRSGVKM